MIVKREDVIDKLIAFKNNNVSAGKSIGWPDVDVNYKFHLGTNTDITGYPYSGKSLLAKEIALNVAKQYGYKGFIWMPDDDGMVPLIANFMNKLTGKTFSKFGAQITDEEIEQQLEWLLNAMLFFERKTSEPRLTPKTFYTMVVENGCQFGVADSWNYFDHGGQITTSYLADVLSYRNEIAYSENVHFIQVIHPRNPGVNDYDKNGNLKPPTVYNMMGGSEWNNNGKNIIVVSKESKEAEGYDISFEKIKPRYVGTTGYQQLYFDIPTQRFYKKYIDPVYDTETIQFAFQEREINKLTNYESNKTLQDQGQSNGDVF